MSRETGRSAHPTSEIEFVYFDLGNVLLAFDPEAACGNVARRFSVTVDQARAAVYESGLQHRFEEGGITGPEFARAVRAQLNIEASQMPDADLFDAISDMFTPIESMVGVLQSVRDRGYGVGLLSNTCHAHWHWIVRQQYAATSYRFDAVILSFEVGAMKPDETIYVAAEQAAAVPAGRLLFLDDKPENVQGAIARGWQAVQCVGGDGATEALRGFGVMP